MLNRIKSFLSVLMNNVLSVHPPVKEEKVKAPQANDQFSSEDIASVFQNLEGDAMEMEFEENDLSAESQMNQMEQDENIQSFVCFMVTKSGNIDLNVSWDTDDEITAKNLATVLHLINTGSFENSCAGLLSNIAQSDPSSTSFIRQVIQEWNSKKKVEPLIKPSEVFQFGTVGVQE